MDVEWRPRDRRKRDIDGPLKALLDSLQHCGIYSDDCLIEELTVRKGKVLKDGAAIVIITAL
jgi:crossover junction endodeoxyribonuclease RusA